MWAYPPLSISFKLHVQSSFIYLLSKSALNINYLSSYLFILAAYLWLIIYVNLTTKFTL